MLCVDSKEFSQDTYIFLSRNIENNPKLSLLSFLIGKTGTTSLFYKEVDFTGTLSFWLQVLYFCNGT